ncbi:expressed unknown protein [Seminavis robusta]|uniref:Uncharacterized protein n=1 Tax=Seminavis robusta TaxID=568900 RepID=A0A9N8E6P1_9STRA|nr:expressed unknown protein [Seminavis robusta]|eukprot:Sro709_g190870.1 n/a (103) ;mRNA; r:28123-28768
MFRVGERVPLKGNLSNSIAMSRRRKTGNRVEEELPLLLVNEDGSISFPFANFLLVGILLTALGRWLWGAGIAVMGLTFAVCHSAMDQMICVKKTNNQSDTTF